MASTTIIRTLSAAVIGMGLALSAQAAEVKSPASVNESAPSKKGDGTAQGGGTPVMPGNKPGSVSESAPSKVGKEPVTPMVKGDSKNLPNPKTPSSVSESAPGKTADKDRKAKGEPAPKY